MTFRSVDALQRTLADTVFKYASDRKKAAGRALGTFVEIVTYYTLRAWDFRDHIVIERSVPEFANPDILHNVEFSLHPITSRDSVRIAPLSLPLTAAKLKKHLASLGETTVKSAQLLSADGLKRNACVIAEEARALAVANIDRLNDSGCDLVICHLLPDPFAIFECKRVGVEEGMRKGPQTIEKAKQGAYVARTVSALQKVRLRSGQFQGVLERRDGTFRTGPYLDLLREVIDRSKVADIRGFILTVGVVSNHGNWFTSSNPNKEMRVLAQSYDWLLFLTDAGLSQFIDKLLLHPTRELEAARRSFLASYSGTSGSNRFTKVRIDVAADEALRSYFAAHEAEVETWFNVTAPRGVQLRRLQTDLRKLAAKDWRSV
ncbi:MAG: hypothetical protein HY897_05970 [Deltaproteobacteria bacterium]|nr:hypothetical protein [Deltaproteobacteria bacterium]